MSQDKAESILTTILSVITGGGAIASTADQIEQFGRIVLLGVSILSGCMLILVNWDKAIKQLNKFFNK